MSGGACCRSCGTGGACESSCSHVGWSVASPPNVLPPAVDFVPGRKPVLAPSPKPSPALMREIDESYATIKGAREVPSGISMTLQQIAGSVYQEAPSAHVGDFGQDVLNVLRSVDDALSEAVVEPVLDALAPTGLGQYTNIIRDVHNTRREAQERAAPRTGPGAIPGLGPSRRTHPGAPPNERLPAPARPASTAAKRPLPLALLASRNTLLPAASISLANLPITTRILEAQRVVRRASGGDAAARAELGRWKAAASSRGDNREARRRWGVATAVMRDDAARITARAVRR